MAHNIRLKFSIFGDELEPSVATAKIGIHPSKSWRKGERTLGTVGPVMSNNGCVFKLDSDPRADLEEQLSAMCDLIESHWDGFAEMCSRFDSELSIMIEVDESAEESLPAIHFDKRVMGILSLLSTEIDIDLYLVEKKSRDRT